MAPRLQSLLKVKPLKRPPTKGVSVTNSYSPQAAQNVLSAPDRRDHLTDLFSSRQSQSADQLLQSLFVHDPDMSAAVNAFLTVADTEPLFLVRKRDGSFDRKGSQQLAALLSSVTSRYDYSKGFEMKQSIRALAESMRYMILLRGGIGEELVFDKNRLPTEIRHVDLNSVKWYEREPNKFTPEQESPQTGDKVLLDVPTFFVGFFRRDPTSIYGHSPFVSAINTVAARQQVINDLYRIMKQTGYPRIEIEIVEEVLRKAAPADVKADGDRLRQFVQQELARIQTEVSSLDPQQPIIHTDSVKFSIFNDKKPSNSLNIDSIIGALNAMNQAGLRSMATILGRGESGVNTASVEARIFSMNAEAINAPIAEVLSQMFTMALRVTTGGDSEVIVKFRPVELRPLTELEPQLALRQARLLKDLSLGIISDDEYHLEMHGRLRPDSAPELSGTGFMEKSSGNEGSANLEKVSPNSDPLGRSVSPEGGEQVRNDNLRN